MQYFKNMKDFIKGKIVFCGIDVHINHWSLCFFCDGEVIEKININPEYPILKHLLSARYLLPE